MFSDLLFRLRSFFQRQRVESDLDDELRAHLDHEIEKYIRAGLPPQEAARRARLALGGFEQIKEEHREARGVHLLENTLRDIRFGARMLRKSPGFTIAAILTLALGIGANTAIFGLVDTAFLRAMPFHQPERLVHIWTTDETGDAHTPSISEFQALQKNTQSYEYVAGGGWGEFFYDAGPSGSQRLSAFFVTPNWLPALGIQPFLGRNFFSEEQIAGADAVVMLSHDCWRTRFHSDPLVLGQKITLDRRPVIVVGVLPQSLGAYYQDIDIFAPLVLGSYRQTGYIRAGMPRVQIVARLKVGVSLAQARSETEVIAQQLRGPRPVVDQSGHLLVEDFAEMLRHPGPTRQNAARGMWMTAVAAALVLLISCANVASLLLARGMKRSREIAVRAALGGSRSRMIRQLLTESTLLFLCGGALGLLIALWGQNSITTIASGLLPGTYLHLNGRVLAACLISSLLCALFFGIIPALRATRVNLTDRLRDGKSHTGEGRSRRLRNGLVVFQMALGMVLLVGFGLLFRSLLHVQSSALGYDPQNVLTATVRLAPSRYTQGPDRERLIRDTLDRVRALPGVASAGIVDSLPMDGAESSVLTIEAQPGQSAPLKAETYFVSVSPEYFSTLKVPLLAGRPFSGSDSFSGSPVVIVNETFAKSYFPGASPVGFHLALGESPTIWREIIGVVSDFRQRNPEEDLRPMAYFPVQQTVPARWSIAMRFRSAVDLASATNRFAGWLRPVDPDLYWQLGTMKQQIYDSESLTLRRPVITLFGGFGALALILALVGVYGLISYSVAERTREIGIRVALGASRPGVLQLVLREALRITLIGLALGSLGAFAIARVFPTQGIGWSGSGIFLYGISRLDPVTYGSAAALLTFIALLATWIPARRATRVDPLVALRYE
jgi:putative ABC transport system permease protein